MPYADPEKRKEYFRGYSRKYNQTKKRREWRKKWAAKYRQTEKHKNYMREYFREYSQREKQKEYVRNFYRKHNARKRIECPEFRLLDNLRRRVRSALAGIGEKSLTTLRLIGCSASAFRAYLEKQFRPGMTWENYGNRKGQWSIDHIRPCVSFDLTNPEQQRQCFHFSNCQPLWVEENCRKHDTYFFP